MAINRPAMRLAGVYAVFGIGWIVLSDKTMLALAPDLLVYSLVGIWKELVFVVATAFVLYAVALRRSRQPDDVAPDEITDSGTRPLILVFAVAAGAIVLLGLGGVAHTAGKQKEKEIERLQAIADLKVGQIVAWFGERHADAKIMRSDDSLVELYQNWRKSGDEGSRRRLAQRLTVHRDAFNYLDVLLLDDSGAVLLGAGGSKHPVLPILRQTARRAIETGQVLSTDLYRMEDAAPARVHLDFIAPLPAAEGQPRLAVAMRADPNRFLFPFIQSWPVPSASAETLLFRRDGDQILFLNELRHRSDTALKQRIPLTQKDLLAVIALEGRAAPGGVVEGVDYRRVPVLGVAKAIEGTPWYLVAKLDKDELYAQAKKDAGWIALADTLAIIIAAAAIRLIHQRRELRFSLIQRRQQAEKLQALQLLDAIAEGSTDAIYAKDAAGRYLLLNRELSRFVGKTREEVLGRDDRAIFQPADAERLMDGDRRVMEAGQVASSEEVLRTTGGIRTFLATRGPLHDADGKVIGLFGIARDITERKQQEREVRASEARFRAIFDGVNDAIFLHDAGTGAILDVNAKMTEMYGYSRKEARHMGIAELSANAAPYTQEDALGWFTRARRGEAPVFEWLARQRDGGLFWVEMSLRRAEIAGRACVLVLARDIGERKRAEAVMRERIELQEQLGKLSQAVEQSPVSIMITDTAGNIEYVNPKFTAVTGYSMSEVLGRNPRLLRSDETPREVHKQLWQTITAGGEWSGELHNRKKNGELFWEHERILPIRDAAGEVTHFLSVKEDITERKRAEEEIRRLNEGLERRVAERTAQLERANREIESFAYSVSHELRAPVRAINGFAHGLLDTEYEAVSEEGREALNRIVRNASRMGQLIEDILEFSRLSGTELTRHPVDMGLLAHASLRELADDYPQTKVSVGALPPAMGDEAMLKQVFANLIGNALKYSARKEGAEIEIGARREDGETVYFVRDNGAGFDMGHAGRLFGVFQRMHAEAEFPGSGVGLAIVKRIVKRHGGRIWAEAAPGQGATFHFTLGAE